MAMCPTNHWGITNQTIEHHQTDFKEASIKKGKRRVFMKIRRRGDPSTFVV